MALARYVLQTNVTVAAGTATSGTYGSASTPGTAWSELWPVTFLRGQVIYADLVAGTAANLLYTALGGAGNLRAFTDGQDSSRGGVSN